MKKDFLFIFLETDIKLFIGSNLSEDVNILYDNKNFVEISIGHFNGFYDWLRNYSGLIIGVRYFPFEDSNFLLKELVQLKYSKTDEHSIDIYFVEEQHRSINEDISDDQKFGGNRIFKSSEGKYLLTFEITEVEEKLALQTYVSRSRY
jgi:hypothetical protein